MPPCLFSLSYNKKKVNVYNAQIYLLFFVLLLNKFTAVLSFAYDIEDNFIKELSKYVAEWRLLFMEKKQTGGIYFAAMNTGEGFKSYFTEVFGDLDRLYIIKGGPGTGKSRFMKDVNAEAESRGFVTEKYLCSSDPTSLDGIVIPALSLGIIDGTAPHAYEPFLSGAKDNIIDLGRFWSVAALKKEISVIEEISKRKARLYRGIYDYLKAVKCYDNIIGDTVKEALDLPKFNHVVKKTAFALGSGENNEKKIKIRSAISDQGVITLNSFAKFAKKRFCILDTCGVGGHFLSALLKETSKNGLSSFVSYDPFSPSLPDAIYYPSSDTSFYIGSETDFEEAYINTRRFINDVTLRPYKPKIRAISRLKKDALKEMFTDFASVKRLHSELESIYGRAMDFDAKESFSNKFIPSLFE